MNLESIVGTILIQEQYRYVRLYHVSRLLVLTAFLLAVSLYANVFLANMPAQYRYIMTEPTGKMMDLVPLDQANVDDETAMRWAVDAVTRIYTFDFTNYRRQFQKAQSMMTVSGWQFLESALQSSGNMDSVIKNAFVTTAVPTGPATLRKKQLIEIGGVRRYQWTIEFPMVVTYRSSTTTTNQELRMEVELVRQPEFVNAAGLGIRTLIAR